MDEASVLKFIKLELNWFHHHLWRVGDSLATPVNLDYQGSSLWYILNGNVDIRIADFKMRISTGEAILLPPTLERYVSTRNGAEWLSIGITASMFGRTTLLTAGDPPVRCQSGNALCDSILQALLQLERECMGDSQVRTTPASITYSVLNASLKQRGCDSAYLMVRAGIDHQLLGLCWRLLGRQDLSWLTALSLPTWLGPILHQIDEAPDISIQRLIVDAGVSPAQMRREFHKWLGTSPQSYVTNIRLERSRQLLGTTDLLVSVVAERVGFESVSHFNLLFKRKFQQTPHQYRQSIVFPMA